MTTISRFFRVFALGTWVGGILLFGMVVAPLLFGKITNMDLAGAIVGLALAKIHQYGVIAAIVYLLFSVLEDRSAKAMIRPASIGVILMLICTLISQMWVFPEMDALRAQMVSYMSTPATSPLRIQFDHLHRFSVHLEIATLILGVISLFLTVWQKTATVAETTVPPAANL